MLLQSFMNTKPTLLLAVIIAVVMITLSPVNAIGAIFGTQYTTNLNVVTYSYYDSTTLCSLSFTINNNNVTNSQSTVFTLSQKPTTSYNSYLPYNSGITLLSVYGLVISTTNTTTLSYIISCTSGIQNLSPSNKRIYVLGSPYFYDSGSVSSNPTDISYSMKVNYGNSTSQLSTIIGFGGFVDSGKADIGYSYPFYGPYQFSYTLSSNIYGQTLEGLKLFLPNVVPSMSKYGFSLGKSYYTSSYYQSMGYSTLYSFKLSTVGNPNLYSSSLQYSYANVNQFKDINGKAISIRINSLMCLCSSDGSSYTTTGSSATTNYLTCSGISSCTYLTIVAKTNAQPIPSSSSTPISATTMYSGTYVYTGTITSKVYYKINVPSGYTLKLKSISKLSTGYGNGYVYINALSSSDSSNSAYIYSSSQSSILSYTNYYSNSKTVYVSVEPSTTNTNIYFVPYVSDSNYAWSIRFPILIAASIVGTLFSLASIVAVIITIKKNSRYQNI